MTLPCSISWVQSPPWGYSPCSMSPTGLIPIPLYQRSVRADGPAWRWGRTALHWAALNGHALVMRTLLCTAQAAQCRAAHMPIHTCQQVQVSLEDNSGETPLQLACHLLAGARQGATQVVEELTRAKASIDTPDGTRSPLHLVAGIPPRLKCVALLLNALIVFGCSSQRTPLCAGTVSMVTRTAGLWQSVQRLWQVQHRRQTSRCCLFKLEAAWG